jgi:hypothetical protein
MHVQRVHQVVSFYTDIDVGNNLLIEKCFQSCVGFLPGEEYDGNFRTIRIDDIDNTVNDLIEVYINSIHAFNKRKRALHKDGLGASPLFLTLCLCHNTAE